MSKRVILVFCILIVSCENGATKLFNFGGSSFTASVFTQYSNDINFSIVQVPKEFLLENEEDQKRITSLDKNDVFIYEFLANDQSDVLKTRTELSYDKAIQHFSQNIAEDFIAINKKGEKIACQGVIHERTFNVRPQQRLILHFERPNDSPIATINYTDRLFNSGLITHQLQNKSIKL
jgi:hypothetical protein